MINLLRTNGIYIRKIEESLEFDNYKETKLKQIRNIIAGIGVDYYYEVIAFLDNNNDSDPKSNLNELTAEWYISRNEVFNIIENHHKIYSNRKQFNVLYDDNFCEIIDGITKLYLYKNTYNENVLYFEKYDKEKIVARDKFIFIPFH